MITVKYSCNQCGLVKREVGVPIRREDEDVVHWVEQTVGRAVKRDHNAVSPHCTATGKLDDAQAWDAGQERSDCPYCPDRVDELIAQMDNLPVKYYKDKGVRAVYGSSSIHYVDKLLQRIKKLEVENELLSLYKESTSGKESARERRIKGLEAALKEIQPYLPYESHIYLIARAALKEKS